MSEILHLAKGFEAKSKQQASDTDAALKLAFRQHEESINAALTSSAATISAAIHDQKASMQRLVLRTWVWVAVSLISVLSLTWCILWYQGSLIADNVQTLNAQRQALALIESKTWGVSLTEDRNGRFIVLPKGASAKTGWTVGKQEAVKIER